MATLTLTLTLTPTPTLTRCKASNSRGACSSTNRASAYSATLTLLEEAAAVRD